MFVVSQPVQPYFTPYNQQSLQPLVVVVVLEASSWGSNSPDLSDEEDLASPELQSMLSGLQTAFTEQQPAVSSDSQLSPSDQQLAQRIDEELDAAADREAGQAMGPDGQPNQGLRGQGELIVQLARQYDLPVELMMAQLQKESCFLSDANNLSIANNNPGNLRFADWEAQDPFNGKPNGPGNFTTFPSVEQGLQAYAHLLRTVYGDFIDRQDWSGMVNKYAPPSENDSALYAQQLEQWQADWREKLGL